MTGDSVRVQHKLLVFLKLVFFRFRIVMKLVRFNWLVMFQWIILVDIIQWLIRCGLGRSDSLAMCR
jgi:hypothetical protein